MDRPLSLIECIMGMEIPVKYIVRLNDLKIELSKKYPRLHSIIKINSSITPLIKDSIDQDLKKKWKIYESCINPDKELNTNQVITYYDGGIKLKEKYHLASGKFHGLYQKWDSDGYKIKEYNYDYGRKHGLCRCWYRNGMLKSEGTYIRGNLNGTLNKWYKNGIMESTHTGMNGMCQGTWTSWDEEGKVIWTYSFRDGKKHGMERRFTDEGRMKTEECYWLGKLYKCRRWYRLDYFYKEVHYNQGNTKSKKIIIRHNSKGKAYPISTYSINHRNVTRDVYEGKHKRFKDFCERAAFLCSLS